MRKKAKMKRKINYKMMQRLSVFHNLVKSGNYPSQEDIIKACMEQLNEDNISLSTFSRDKETLKNAFNAPLAYSKKNNGYYYYSPDFELTFNNKINAEQVFCLSICKSLLSGLEGSPMYDKISKVMDYISCSNVGNVSFSSRICAVPKPYSPNLPKNVWDAIIEALQYNEIIEFDYIGHGGGTISYRRAHPYQLLPNDGIPMVFCYDELADSGNGGERLFALSRIKNIKKTGKTFILPENYDFASRCKGGKFGLYIGDNSDEYEIDLYYDARQDVRDYIWADDQVIEENEEKKCTTIKFTSVQIVKVLGWVLAHGKYAIPRKPEKLVRLWKYHIDEMKINADKVNL